MCATVLCYAVKSGGRAVNSVAPAGGNILSGVRGARDHLNDLIQIFKRLAAFNLNKQAQVFSACAISLGTRLHVEPVQCWLQRRARHEGIPLGVHHAAGVVRSVHHGDQNGLRAKIQHLLQQR